ncbi:MAG: bacteriohopanetetrol glucosamine biosynthesis glycosyltransferase HpnI [Pseudomonadota bacterium]|nr:bacteriohopanetetrol glucosamine biosynthesis glycosyltransferase HpnI [Pseudomonadota bacterium]
MPKGCDREMNIPVVVWVLSLLIWLSILYEIAVIVAFYRWRRNRAAQATITLPVTVLKPLHGLETELYENLRSFCVQDYPQFQIVFGAQDESDPAIAVVRRLQKEFPEADLKLVINGYSIGVNRKVCNLHNMLIKARHDTLVLSDADVRVRPDYLRVVVDPLQDPDVGVVTCPYRGLACSGIWSSLLALQINEGFFPSVLVAKIFGSSLYSSGVTLALRRQSLDAMGGFPVLADRLADDYWLAALIRAQGLKTVLIPYLVDTVVKEESFTIFYHHALRWSRTIRSVQPLGHAFSFLTYPVPLVLLFIFAGGSPGSASLWLALALRLIVHYDVSNLMHRSKNGNGRQLFWVADFLGFVIWLHSFWGRRIRWQQESFSVRPDGRMVNR